MSGFLKDIVKQTTPGLINGMTGTNLGSVGQGIYGLAKKDYGTATGGFLDAMNNGSTSGNFGTGSNFGKGGLLFDNLMPQKKNVEQDATNGLVNETSLDQEIQNQAPKAEGGDLGFGKGGFDWKNALGSALSNFGSGGGESSSQQAPVSFNPQNAQIAQAQMIQPTQQQALANIGKRSLYDYLMG